MAVLLCSNLLSGRTGLDKSLVMTANHLTRAGYPLTVLNFIGPGDGSRYVVPHWPFDFGLPVHALQTLPADGGKKLATSFFARIQGQIPRLRFDFTDNALAALRHLNQQLSSSDTVIFTHPVQAWAFCSAIGSDPRRVRTVLQIHGDYRREHPELMEMLHAARSVVDQVQIVSQGMQKDFVDTFGLDGVTWIPNIHEPAPVRRTELSGFNIVLAGSFQPRKNQLDAIRALARVQRSDARLTLWGNPDNEYGEEVRSLAEKLGVSTRVLMPGVGTEAAIYSEADVVIIPSLSEGFGYSLVEAASHGVPVVAYDYEHGPRDVILDGVSGHIVPLGDVGALAQRLTGLATNDRVRKKMGDAARKVFEERFSPARIVERYQGLLGPPGGTQLDLDEMFPVGPPDPVPLTSIRARSFAVAGREVLHLLSFRSTCPVRDPQVTTRAKTRRGRLLRLRDRYHTVLIRGSLGPRFYRAQQKVLTYATDDAEAGRFYLGHTTRSGAFQVARYLRRDAAPPGPRPSTQLELNDGYGSIPRHPRRHVSSYRDGLGAAGAGLAAVELRNAGDLARPLAGVSGEWDSIELFDGHSAHRLVSPLPYGELFSRLCEAERSHGLLERSVGGIYPWELYRAAFVAHASEGLGLWGRQFTPGTQVKRPTHDGFKRLTAARRHRKVLFEFPRKPFGPDARTLPFQDDSTMIIEYPQPWGYSPDIEALDNRYPIEEFLRWREDRSSRVRDIDPAPYEKALGEAFGFPVSLGRNLTARARKFLEEREFWTQVFRRVQPDEVIIPSSHWSAGICAAATGVGARVSDIQYALTSRLHPSYWFGQRPPNGASLLYAWSPFWAERTNAYSRFEYVPRALPPRPEAVASEFDICFVSQPRVFRRLLRALESIISAHPTARICVAPHPDERAVFASKLSSMTGTDRVTIASVSTLEAIRRSEVCIGAYSTSLYEAASLGKPTYVVPVPGHELLAEEIASGWFRLLEDPEALEPFEVPTAARCIFGAPL